MSMTKQDRLSTPLAPPSPRCGPVSFVPFTRVSAGGDKVVVPLPQAEVGRLISPTLIDILPTPGLPF